MVRVMRIVQGKTHLLRSAIVLGALGMLLLTGCHTTSGFGQDVQSLGRDIQRNSDKNVR
jgi:predicted small secreted protein